MGIDNYYFKNFRSYLVKDEYWDFHITSDNVGMSLPYLTSCDTRSQFNCSESDLFEPRIVSDDSLVFWLDVNHQDNLGQNNFLSSQVSWSGSSIKPTSGMTLDDFGLTGVDNGRVTNLTDSITLTEYDNKLDLYLVSGETYDYPNGYFSGSTFSGVTGCDGSDIGRTSCGFYQGFFKIDFDKPSPIVEEKVSVDSCGNTITGSTITEPDSDAEFYQIGPTDFENGWTMETWLTPNGGCYNDFSGNTLNNKYPNNKGFFFYIGTRAENKFNDVFSGESGYTTSSGLPLQPNIEVDEGNDGGQSWFSVSNPDLVGASSDYLSCCCRDSNNEIINVTRSGSTKPYCSQIAENALGFRVTEDNALGWRKVTLTSGCTEDGFSTLKEVVVEDYTEPNIFESGDKPMLVQVVYKSGSVNYFGLPSGVLKMYLNGRLVLTSKEFTSLQLRALNEWSEKQEGVPYNISWGGGTQGLCESKTFNGPDLKDFGLTLEKNFAGTFEGELSQLRFYDKPLNILELRNNLFFDCNRYCVTESFGGLKNKCSKTKITQNPPSSGDGGLFYGKTPNTDLNDDTLLSLINVQSETTIGVNLSISEGHGYVFVLIPKELGEITTIKSGRDCCDSQFTIPFINSGEITTNVIGGSNKTYFVYRTYNKTNYIGDFVICA